MVSQEYGTDVNKELDIAVNSSIIKFYHQFFYHQVLSSILLSSVVSQEYGTDASTERVIAGNYAIVKCAIPSFIADFVTVTGWLEESQDVEYFPSDNFGTMINYFRMCKSWCVFSAERSFRFLKILNKDMSHFITSLLRLLTSTLILQIISIYLGN